MKDMLLLWKFKPDPNSSYTFKRGNTKIVLWKDIEFATIHTKSHKQTFASKESLYDFLLKTFKQPQLWGSFFWTLRAFFIYEILIKPRVFWHFFPLKFIISLEINYLCNLNSFDWTFSGHFLVKPRVFWHFLVIFGLWTAKNWPWTLIFLSESIYFSKENWNIFLLNLDWDVWIFVY